MFRLFYFLIILISFSSCCCKKRCGANNGKERICYTSGTFDMFHIGHLNLLRNAKGICDKLIVGVHPDETVFKNKNKYPVIPLEQRMEIIRNIKYVDFVISEPEYNYTKDMVDKLKINTLIIGDDYVVKYKELEKEMMSYGVQMIFLPYTTSQSSTKIRDKLKNNPSSQEVKKNNSK